MPAPMALGPSGEPRHDSAGPRRPPSFAGLRAAAGFLLTSLPLGIFWFVVLAAPILLGAFLAAVWLVVMRNITLALLRWTGKLQWQTLVRGLALICAPMTSVAVCGTQIERRRVAGALGFPISSPYRRSPEGRRFLASRCELEIQPSGAISPTCSCSRS